MTSPLIMTGPRAILKIGGQVIAFASNVSYRVAQPHQAIICLGRYSVARHEPTGYDVSLTCSAFRFCKQGGKGNAPDGKTLSRKIMPTLNDLISAEDLTIEVFDRNTDELLLAMFNSRLTDRTGNLGARDVLSETWSFVGVRSESDDSGPQQESSGSGSIPPNTEAAQ